MKFLKTYQIFEKELSEIEKSITDLQNREVTAETADAFKNDMKKLTQDLIDSNFSEIESNRLADLIYQLNNKIPEGNRFFVKEESRKNKTRLESQFIDVGKIKGTDIDNDDFRRYINCLISLLENKFDVLSTTKKDFEYISPDDVATKIDAIHRGGLGYWMFKYKESNFDKIKFKIGLDSFKPEYKDDIIRDLQAMVDTTTPEGVSLAQTVSDMSAKSDIAPTFGQVPGIEPTAAPPTEQETKGDETIRKADANAAVVINKDDTFVKDTIVLMVNEKLVDGFVDSDEDKIYQWFLSKENQLKTMNKANIDAILQGYKAEMAKPKLQESFIDDSINSIKRASQSVISTKSSGLVKDLLNAFNSDTAQVNRDINEVLKSFTTFFQNDINAYVTKKESVTVATGLLGAGLVFAGYKTYRLVKGVNGFIGNMFGNGIKMGKIPAKGGWVAAALIATYAGYNIYKGVNNQQKQIATILINMYSSGSTLFADECKKAGIVFPNYTIDTTSLQKFMTPTSESVSSEKDDISKLFRFFNKRKVDNKIAVSLVSQHLGLNKILFIVDKPMSEDSRDIVNFYICYDNKYYSVDGEFDKAELCQKEKLTKSTFNDKTFFGNSFKTKVILKDMKIKAEPHILKEYEHIIKNEK